jgi:putative endonuclease
MFTTYVLESIETHRHYIGSTGDFDRRLCEHQRGQCPTSRKLIPFVVLYTKDFDNRSDAYAYERKLKSFKNGEAFKKLFT